MQKAQATTRVGRASRREASELAGMVNELARTEGLPPSEGLEEALLPIISRKTPVDLHVLRTEEGMAGYMLSCPSIKPDIGGTRLTLGRDMLELYISERFRLQGCATAAMKFLKNLTSEENGEYLRWMVHKGNIPAINFYQKFGTRYSSSQYMVLRPDVLDDNPTFTTVMREYGHTVRMTVSDDHNPLGEIIMYQGFDSSLPGLVAYVSLIKARPSQIGSVLSAAWAFARRRWTAGNMVVLCEPWLARQMDEFFQDCPWALPFSMAVEPKGSHLSKGTGVRPHKSFFELIETSRIRQI